LTGTGTFVSVVPGRGGVKALEGDYRRDGR
jgi:hypothetical protein